MTTENKLASYAVPALTTSTEFGEVTFSRIVLIYCYAAALGVVLPESLGFGVETRTPSFRLEPSSAYQCRIVFWRARVQTCREFWLFQLGLRLREIL